ncbi:MAG: flagellin [Candidatus Bathyarchaeota archaeon]|nr:flagellin [Candidatus Bathyarchaeota archaeon]
MRKLLKSKKGIVGIEAAIVLIAFIIIAAALSYVVINMGFYTTQKTKETMAAGVEESTSALLLDGVVTGKTNASVGEIEYLIIPVKLSVGKTPLDLKEDAVVVSVYLPNTTLMNIYKGYNVTTDADWDTLKTTLGLSADEAQFAIYNDNGNENSLLESTEKAFLVICLGSGHTIADYENLKIEVKTAKGAALTVVRTAPGGMTANAFVDLG